MENGCLTRQPFFLPVTIRIKRAPFKGALYLYLKKLLYRETLTATAAPAGIRIIKIKSFAV